MDTETPQRVGKLWGASASYREGAEKRDGVLLGQEVHTFHGNSETGTSRCCACNLLSCELSACDARPNIVISKVLQTPQQSVCRLRFTSEIPCGSPSAHRA